MNTCLAAVSCDSQAASKNYYGGGSAHAAFRQDENSGNAGNGKRNLAIFLVRAPAFDNVGSYMKASHNPIDSYDNYLGEAQEYFKNDQTSEGLVSLTMALQEMGTLLHDIQRRLNNADGLDE